MNEKATRGIVIAVIVFLLIAGIFIAVSSMQLFYLFVKVDPGWVAVQIKSGQITNVVGPGVYSDFGLYTQLVPVKVSAVTIDVTDPELITSDKQRVGLQVTADAFRPDIGKGDVIRSKWDQYRELYISDEALRTRIDSFALQSMKVCVGDRTFDQAVIGSGRDDLRQCIDEELSGLSAQVGLDIQNVSVPQIIISTEVQASLDAIVQSRLMTEKARQDAERAKQEAAAKQAAQEGEIRVQQSVMQETARQETTLADLERLKLEAQIAVIEAQQTNALKQLELQRVQLEIAKIDAQIELATEIARATLVTDNPNYLTWIIAQANASALRETDKVIFTPEGVFPNLIFGNALPTVTTTTTPNPQ
jgi:hypothetical protein